MQTVEAKRTLEQIRTYYGKTLQTNDDLKTGACCSADSFPKYLQLILSLIDPEIIEKFYGCGSPIPSSLGAQTVVDLGCGTGRDVYLVSKLVGPEGRVIGVDMTEQQLDIARGHVDGQMERFGFAESNVRFAHGFIEDIADVGIEAASVDVVISNCVLNLSPDKHRVFSEIFRVLKPGGELFFSDIFAGRRIPENLQNDPVLRGECLGGAMYLEDFRRLLRELGCMDYRVVNERRVPLNDPEVEAKLGMIDFRSLTIRAFKLDTLEDICEDYGQVAIYRGSIPESPHHFELDDHHTFRTGKPMLVCGNTASMLEETRYGKHFTILGDRSTHYGPFDCSSHPVQAGADGTAGCC